MAVGGPVVNLRSEPRCISPSQPCSPPPSRSELTRRPPVPPLGPPKRWARTVLNSTLLYGTLPDWQSSDKAAPAPASPLKATASPPEEPLKRPLAQNKIKVVNEAPAPETQLESEAPIDGVTIKTEAVSSSDLDEKEEIAALFEMTMPESLSSQRVTTKVEPPDETVIAVPQRKRLKFVEEPKPDRSPEWKAKKLAQLADGPTTSEEQTLSEMQDSEQQSTSNATAK